MNAGVKIGFGIRVCGEQWFFLVFFYGPDVYRPLNFLNLMSYQHTAIEADMYTAKELQVQENRAWIFFVYLSIIFTVASILLYYSIPTEEFKQLSYESRATLEKMPLIAVFFIVGAIATRFSSRIRMFFYDKYVVDSLRLAYPLLCKSYNQSGILIKASAIDNVIFFCNKQRKPFYVWAVVEAVDENTGIEGYAVFHYDLSRNNRLWLPVYLFVTGSIQECVSRLQQLSEKINRRQEIFSKTEGTKKRHPVEDIFVLERMQ